MSEQKKAEEFGITEDDVSEIRQVGTTCRLLIGCFLAILWLLIGQEIHNQHCSEPAGYQQVPF